MNVTSSSLVFHVGKLTYDVVNEKKGSISLVIIYGIAGGGGAVLLLFVILMFFLYRRKRKQQRQTERTFEMQINTLESKVAKECKEGNLI